MKHIITTALLALGLGSGAALAQQSGDEMLQQHDTDGDGGVSREEAQASPELSQAFDTADADGDGTLNTEEIEQAMAGGGSTGGETGSGETGTGETG